MGLRELQILGLKGDGFEADSMVVVNWDKGSSLGPWQLAHIMHEIKELVLELVPSIHSCKEAWYKVRRSSFGKLIPFRFYK